MLRTPEKPSSSFKYNLHCVLSIIFIILCIVISKKKKLTILCEFCRANITRNNETILCTNAQTGNLRFLSLSQLAHLGRQRKILNPRIRKLLMIYLVHYQVVPEMHLSDGNSFSQKQFSGS